MVALGRKFGIRPRPRVGPIRRPIIPLPIFGPFNIVIIIVFLLILFISILVGLFSGRRGFRNINKKKSNKKNRI